MANTDDDKIVKIVELSAPIGRVWNALTNHEEFGQWFRVYLDQPFEVGAKSTGQMTYPGHEDCLWIAYVERMEPGCLFSFRWYASDEGATEQSEDQPGILVEFRLKEVPDGTRLTITESGFSALPDPQRVKLMRSNEKGWNTQADSFAEYLST